MVPCGGWPLEVSARHVGQTNVVYGVAVDEAVAVRYPRIGGQNGIIWTRRLPGLPHRWFAVALHVHEVQGAGNVFEALDAQGRELGSTHDNRGNGTFPPFDGRWERRFHKRSIPGCR